MENLIEINPKIMVGKPVIKGTRITVELILEKLAIGDSFETILSDYPHLSRDEVASAVRFALKTVRHDFPPHTENKRIFEAVNEAYKDTISSDETEQLRLIKNRSVEILDDCYRYAGSG